MQLQTMNMHTAYHVHQARLIRANKEGPPTYLPFAFCQESKILLLLHFAVGSGHVQKFRSQQSGLLRACVGEGVCVGACVCGTSVSIHVFASVYV